MTQEDTHMDANEPTQNTQEEHAPAQTTDSGRRYNIILLDDDSFLLDMYTTKFTQEGHDVQACLSPEEAIKALRSGFAADAVMFDLIMPNQDGFDFLQTLKDENLATEAVLVALTNQGEDEEREKTQSLGADAYIVKANTVPSEVVKKVVDMIRARDGA